jgi:SNF2 family DNA or RNA helicase
MPPEQAKAYERIIASAKGCNGSRAQMLKVLHNMRGVSLHPDGVRDVNPLDETSALRWLEGSARLRKAYKILEVLRGRGEKALVFVEYIGVQSIFAEAMATLLNLEHIPEIINGGVPGERRQDIVRRFQERGPGFDILLLSPKAAGVGLTITAATHVIHLSRWWNPAVEDQCNDRAYRIGQTRDVTIHVPMAIHPDFGDQSFDVKLDQLLTRKRDLSRDMLIPPRDGRRSLLLV